MITIFPAAAGTLLLTLDHRTSPPSIIRTPVIGWQHIQGPIAFPITVLNYGGMTHGNAIAHPDGMVSDPIHRLAFNTVAEWSAFMKTAKAPKSEPVAPPTEPVDEDDGVTGTPEPPKPVNTSGVSPRAVKEALDTKAGERVVMETVRKIPDKPKGRPQVFKSKSFWKFVHEPHVFMVEGGVEAPAKSDGDYEKITREEWLDLKKRSHTLLEWPLEDDDGMNLV